VIYIGETPVKSTFYVGANEAGVDRQIQSIMAELKGLKNVKQAPAFSDVPAALASLGIGSDAQYSLTAEQSKLINLHRGVNGIDYFYVYNRGFNANSASQYGWNYGAVKEQTIPDVSTMITFKAKGTPYRFNTWTGEIIPIANYTVSGGLITLPVSLRGNESTVFAFDYGNVLGTANDNKIRVAASVGVNAYYDARGRLAVKSSSNGQRHIALSNGSAKDIQVAGASSPIVLGNWKLKVEDWEPGPTATTTAKSIIDVNLGDLKPWKDVPELQYSSGIGTYTTTFDMVKGWKEGVGAVLNLGIVDFGYKLMIDGTEVKTNQENTAVDIGPYVKAGTNTVVVEVTTTLNNRLKKLYNVARRTDDHYGLIGSGGASATDGLGGTVTVTPYVVTVLQ